MAKPVWTNTQVIDQLDSRSHWSGTALTYGFPTSATWFPFQEAETATALNSAQQTFATLTIRLWDDLIDPDFAFAGDGATANIKYMNTTTDIGYAHAYYPGSHPVAGSIWFNPEYDANSGTNNLVSPTVGTWGWSTYIHEAGHALGLNHPGDYDGGSPTYATDALFANDSQMYTIMSYFTASNTGADWIASDGKTYYAQTPMLYDVMAIQAMYGAEATTRTDNTTYGFNATADNWLYDFTQNRHPVLCIYDSGGTDTLDLSGWSYACTINLVPGSYSSSDMMAYNISIAYDTWIENGVGGSGNDTLTGSDVANQLYGLAGDDRLTGGAGDDIIDGGTGTDTAVFSGARADYSITWDAANSTFTVIDTRTDGSDGADQVRNVEDFAFSDGMVSASDLPLASGDGGFDLSVLFHASTQNESQAKGLTAAYVYMGFGVPSRSGYEYLFNSNNTTNFGAGAGIEFNDENIYINTLNALYQGNSAARTTFDSIIIGDSLQEKLTAVYESIIPLSEQDADGLNYFVDSAAFYDARAAEIGIPGISGAALVGAAALIKIAVDNDIPGIGDSIIDLLNAVDDGSAVIPTNGGFTPIEIADGTHFDNDDDSMAIVGITNDFA